MFEDLIEKVQSIKLSDEVAKRIRELILSGEVKPGDKLPPEIELAKLFGVGRSTIRDAINELKGSGFVETRKPQGIFVLPLTDTLLKNPLIALMENEMKNVYDFINIRKNLEADSAALAAENATKSELKKMEQAIRGMEQARGLHREKLWNQGDNEFHLTIVKASKNVVMMHIIDTFAVLMSSLRHTLRLVVDTEEKLDAVLAEHQRIYDAIARGDSIEARNSMIKHMDATIIRIKDAKLIQEQGELK